MLAGCHGSSSLSKVWSLHETQGGSVHYDRIVLVGHSLGSIVAYDLLKYCWDRYSLTFKGLNSLDRPTHAAQESLKKAIHSLRLDPSDQNRNRFREAQHEYWRELRRLGNPWLVTDFVSIGSPLAHAAVLLARDKADLCSLQEEGEMPTCPPVPSSVSSILRKNYRAGPNNEKRTIRCFGPAGMFSCTRWTNIFFPSRFGFWGDLIAGPLHRVFGEGIRDLPVTPRGSARWIPLRSHGQYWAVTPSGDGQIKADQALTALQAALDLNSFKWLRGTSKAGK